MREGGKIDSIAVLVHERQGAPNGYYIDYVMAVWRTQGRRVLVHCGLDTPPPAQAALLHLDLTVYPAPYRALGAAFPRPLNAATASMAKRVVSQNLVTRDDDYDGPVIVKSDLNYGGLPEHLLAQPPTQRRTWSAFGRRLWKSARQRPPGDDYRIYAAKRLVPQTDWRDRSLVVERLLLDRAAVDGRQLCGIHQWFCLGDRGIVLTYRSPDPLIRYGNTTHIEPLHDRVPDAIRQRRSELGVDYGKLDYVVADGEAHLLDVNRSPYLGEPPWSQTTDLICRTLAAGIDGYANAHRPFAAQVPA